AIARHLLAAAADGSDPIPGVEAALRAASGAVERYTYEDAIGLLQLARAAMESSAAVALACEIDIALAVAMRSAGIYPEREGLLESAWSGADASGDAELAAEVVIEGCAVAGYPTGQWLARIEATRDRLDPSTRGHLMLTAVLCHTLAREPGDRARELAEWAVA